MAGNAAGYCSKFYMILLCHLIMLVECKYVVPLTQHYCIRWELKTAQLVLIFLPCPGMVMFPRC